MQFARQFIEVAFAYIISTPLTNLCRAKDSSPDSPNNKTLIKAFQASLGWSTQLPLVGCPMSLWPFTAAELPNGCSAQEYVDRENTRRADKHVVLSNNLSKEQKDADVCALQAFEELYCVDGKLIELTIDNSYWVHSGHQRSQFVFMQAYADHLLRLKAHVEGDVVEDYHLTVPVIEVLSYTDINDIARDQMGINSSVGEQNRLQVLDYARTAVRIIGKTGAPKITEREFRNWCAEKGSGDSQGTNSGAYPRHGYLIAEANRAFFGKYPLYNYLVAPKTIPVEGEAEAVPNPVYIDLKDVALTHTDPLCSIAVICRLLDFDKLSKYMATYGPHDSKGNLKPADKDQSSAIEKTVFARGYAYSEEEYAAWFLTKQGGKTIPTYKGPVITTPVVAYKTDAAAAIIKSSSAADVLKDLLSEHVMGNKTGAVDLVNERHEAFDLVYELDGTVESDKTFLSCLEGISGYREGNPDGYVKLVAAIKKLCDKALPAASTESTTA